MKKKNVFAAAVLVAAFMSPLQAGAQSTVGSILSKVASAKASQTGGTGSSAQSALGSLIGNVIGSTKTTEKDLVGTWKYSSPKCSFTSSNLLAQAGGAVAAKKLENKAQTYYTKAGITGKNTQFTFNEDKTFTALIHGKKVSGTYTYDTKTGQIVLKGLVAHLNAYATRQGSNKLDLVFESTKLLTLFQTVGKMSGNATLTTLSNLSKSYKGSRMGFEMTKG